LLLALTTWTNANRDATQAASEAAWTTAMGRASAVERAAPAVVSVRARGSRKKEQGSGVLVDASGLVLTAYHVVDGASTILVRTSTGAEFSAMVHGTDPAADLALLKPIGVQANLPAARLGKSSEARVGEDIVALASPYGLVGTATTGIISARGRTGVVRDNVVPLLQTDASIHPGSSGGVLINLRGEVIGLINAILTRGGTGQGIGFAVPVDEIRRVLPDLRAQRPVERPWIGVHVDRRTPKAAGIEVLSTVSGGPAASAGLRPGDRITRMGGRRLQSVADMRGLLRACAVGSTVRLEFVREDETLEAEVDVGKKKNPEQIPNASPRLVRCKG
jgi:serine protease DegS